MNGSNSNTSGDQVAIVDAIADPNGTIPMEKMQEIARRLAITVQSQTSGNVIYSPGEPTDKTKVWWQTDPVTGIPIAQPKTYNSESSLWETYSPPGSTVVLKKRRTGEITVAAGVGPQSVPFTFTDMETVNYSVRLTPTTKNGASFNAAPTTNIQNYEVTAMSGNTIAVSFHNVPTGGLTYLVEIVENE